MPGYSKSDPEFPDLNKFDCEIPEGWNKTHLGHVIDDIEAQRPKKPDIVFEGENPYYVRSAHSTAYQELHGVVEEELAHLGFQYGFKLAETPKCITLESEEVEDYLLGGRVDVLASINTDKGVREIHAVANISNLMLESWEEAEIVGTKEVIDLNSPEFLKYLAQGPVPQDKTFGGAAAVMFWTGSYAPTMVQVEAVDKEITQEIIEDVTYANGGVNPLGSETSALISYEDAEMVLTTDEYQELLDEGQVIISDFDLWTLRQLYGYAYN